MVQVEPAIVPMLKPTFAGASSPSEVSVAVTVPVAAVKNWCVWPPLMFSVPVKVSVVITGSGVVGSSSIDARAGGHRAAASDTIKTRSITRFCICIF